ncbi:hypothetical protein BC827DRAFT_887578 [Russula dissimulans]|nr:hypothetical protein BC827DRAFT_887578 [Russula dissimulans]
MWEFIWSIGYEYSIITGRRKLTWTSPIYIGTRWLTLVLVILQFVAFNMQHGITCQTMITLNFVFGTFSLLSASTLVILPLHSGNKTIYHCHRLHFMALWLTNATIYLYSMSSFRGEYGEGYCRFNRGSHVDILVLCTFITDFSMLALMVAGVLRWPNIRGRGGIWRLLYTQLFQSRSLASFDFRLFASQRCHGSDVLVPGSLP